MNYERAYRQAERAAKARQRELERARKEMAKLSAIEQARLEVAEFENRIELLLSLHKESSPVIDWETFGSLLPPCPPIRAPRRELAYLLDQARNWPATIRADGTADASVGIPEDEAAYQTALLGYERTLADWIRVRALAKRVLAGEPRAYTEALSEFSNLAEISALGSAVEITVHSPRLVECRLQVKGREVIPAEVKALTSSGKLSVKSMPKGRFHEVYQDYVCSAVLRLARVITTTLPVRTVLVTASIEETDSHTGRTGEIPVLSVELTRAGVDRLNFESLDPSDSIETFTHRGDVLASRKTGTFWPITPLAPRELVVANPEEDAISTLIGRARELRLQISRERKRLEPAVHDDSAQLFPES
jgi:hypothetical protein